MKMYEIIDFMLDPNYLTASISYEVISKYKNSLYTYFKNYFACEPVLMVTSVTNNSTYMRIVPSNEFDEEVRWYVESSDIDIEDWSDEIESINFNSKMMYEII